MADIFEGIVDNWMFCMRDRDQYLRDACRKHLSLLYKIPSIITVYKKKNFEAEEIRIWFVFNRVGRPELKIEFTFYYLDYVCPILKVEAGEVHLIAIPNVEYSADDVVGIVVKIYDEYIKDQLFQCSIEQILEI